MLTTTIKVKNRGLNLNLSEFKLRKGSYTVVLCELAEESISEKLVWCLARHKDAYAHRTTPAEKQLISLTSRVCMQLYMSVPGTLFVLGLARVCRQRARSSWSLQR
jgi:hypothetical protein